MKEPKKITMILAVIFYVFSASLLAMTICFGPDFIFSKKGLECLIGSVGFLGGILCLLQVMVHELAKDSQDMETSEDDTEKTEEDPDKEKTNQREEF